MIKNKTNKSKPHNSEESFRKQTSNFLPATKPQKSQSIFRRFKMMKPFQWTLWSGIASCSLRLLANAASTEKESEVESILQKLESDVRAFRDEIERVYGARCETETLTECYKSSFNACDSTFPNQQCLKADEFVMSTCGDGVGCNGECVREDTSGLNMLRWYLSTKFTNGKRCGIRQSPRFQYQNP
jgi:hypothetical protein